MLTVANTKANLETKSFYAATFSLKYASCLLNLLSLP